MCDTNWCTTRQPLMKFVVTCAPSLCEYGPFYRTEIKTLGSVGYINVTVEFSRQIYVEKCDTYQWM